MLDLNGLFLAGRGFEQDLDRGLPPALHIGIPKSVLRLILMHQRLLGLVLVHHVSNFAFIRMQAAAIGCDLYQPSLRDVTRPAGAACAHRR